MRDCRKALSSLIFGETTVIASRSRGLRPTTLVYYKRFFLSALSGAVVVGQFVLTPATLLADESKAREKELIKFSMQGDIGQVRTLADAGVNLNAATEKGLTSLMLASLQGHVEVVKLLLASKKVDVNAKDITGTTSLMAAAKRGHVEIVRLLLEADAKLDNQSEQGMTALAMAAMDGHMDVVNLLVSRGANLNLKAANGLTAMGMASLKGHATVIDLLKSKGAQ